MGLTEATIAFQDFARWRVSIGDSRPFKLQSYHDRMNVMDKVFVPPYSWSHLHISSVVIYLIRVVNSAVARRPDPSEAWTFWFVKMQVQIYVEIGTLSRYKPKDPS